MNKPPVKVQGQPRPAVRLGGAAAKVVIKGAKPQVKIAGNWRDDFPTRRSSPGESSD
jgi:hypothetical protein